MVPNLPIRNNGAFDNVICMFQKKEGPVDDVQGENFLMVAFAGLSETEGMPQNFDFPLYEVADRVDGRVISPNRNMYDKRGEMTKDGVVRIVPSIERSGKNVEFQPRNGFDVKEREEGDERSEVLGE